MNWEILPARSKVAITLVSIVLIIVIVATSLIVMVQVDHEKELAYKSCSEMTKYYANTFDGDMRADFALARAIGSSMSEYGSGDRQEVNSILRRLLKDNPHIMGSFVCYEVNAFDGADEQYAGTSGHDDTGRFIPYWNRINGDISLDPLLDYDSSSYYLEPKVLRKDLITDPYYYEGVFIVTYVSPIIRDGEFLGAGGVDVSLDHIDDQVSPIEVYDTGYALMVGSDGMLLSHPHNKSWIGSRTLYEYGNYDFYSIAEDLKYKKGGYVAAVDPTTGKDVIVFYEPLEIKNYGFLLVVPQDELFAGATLLRNQLMGVSIFLVLFVGLVTYLFSRSTTDSIDRIVDDFKELADAAAAGNLNLRANTDVNIEFRKIPEGYNQIIDAVLLPVNETIRVVDKLSKGDLEARFELEVEGEFKELADSVNHFASTLDDIVEDSNEVLLALQNEDFSRTVKVHGEGSLKKLTGGVERTHGALEVSSIRRQRSENELREYARKLEHSNELKDIFTDILSHDLLNPAGVVRGYTDIMIGEETDEKKRLYLKKIKKNNDNLIELIQSSAEFARLDSSEDLVLEKLDITALVRQSIELLQIQVDEKRISIDFDDSVSRYALANPIIATVFTNFISNSIKYSPEKTTVFIRIEEDGDCLEVSVTDQGEGIQNEHKKAIFERFRRVTKGIVKGSGLGLAIVKRIVDLHDGTVGVKDNPAGDGSVFWVKVRKYMDD